MHGFCYNYSLSILFNWPVSENNGAEVENWLADGNAKSIKRILQAPSANDMLIDSEFKY